MKIIVTQDHINRGWRESFSHCPVALALKSQGLIDPVVAGDWIEFKREGHSHKLPMPDEVTYFVINFDSEDDDDCRDIPTPFDFDLEVEA